MLSGKRLSFLGAGSMAQALVAGLVGGGIVGPCNVTVTNRYNDERLNRLQDRWGVRITRDKGELVRSADVLVLACKPTDLTSALNEIGSHVRPEQTVISVAAGVNTAVIESALPRGTAVLRAMPNTSSLVKESATALCGGRWAREEHLALGDAIFGSVGKVSIVPEEALDTITALSGSGPAYIYYFTEALIEAGVGLGMDPETAKALVVQTLYGAAKMLNETGADPAELRRQVTSPNGTTAAALKVMAERGLKDIIAAAVSRAAERSREIGENAGSPESRAAVG